MIERGKWQFFLLGLMVFTAVVGVTGYALWILWPNVELRALVAFFLGCKVLSWCGAITKEGGLDGDNL